MHRIKLILPLFLATLNYGSLQMQAQANYLSATSGNMDFEMTANLHDSLKAVGIKMQLGGYAFSRVSGEGFTIGGGVIDSTTGVGELSTTGDLRLSQGSQVLDLMDWSFVNLATSAYISCAIYQNGILQGRQTVFTLSNNAIGGVSAGVVQTNAAYIAFDTNFAAGMVQFFQVPQLAPSLQGTVGFTDFLMTLATPKKLTAF